MTVPYWTFRVPTKWSKTASFLESPTNCVSHRSSRGICGFSWVTHGTQKHMFGEVFTIDDWNHQSFGHFGATGIPSTSGYYQGKSDPVWNGFKQVFFNWSKPVWNRFKAILFNRSQRCFLSQIVTIFWKQMPCFCKSNVTSKKMNPSRSTFALGAQELEKGTVPFTHNVGCHNVLGIFWEMFEGCFEKLVYFLLNIRFSEFSGSSNDPVCCPKFPVGTQPPIRTGRSEPLHPMNWWLPATVYLGTV